MVKHLKDYFTVLKHCWKVAKALQYNVAAIIQYNGLGMSVLSVLRRQCVLCGCTCILISWMVHRVFVFIPFLVNLSSAVVPNN